MDGMTGTIWRTGMTTMEVNCWDLPSDITKTSNPSPLTPNKVEFGAKWVEMSAFFGHNIAGESGGMTV